MIVATPDLLIVAHQHREVMSTRIVVPREWACNGAELKLRNGATASTTWIFDGKEIKPKTGAVSGNTWLFDGKELRPKAGATSSNTWTVERDRIKPKSGATSTNTYEIGDLPILAVAGHLVLRLY